MNADKNNKYFDELITKAIGRDKPKFNFDKWKQSHKSEVEIFESQPANKQVSCSTPFMNIWSAVLRTNTGRVAIAACLIIAALIILRPSSNSIDGTTAVYAKMNEAVKNVPWMRITSTTQLVDPNGNLKGDLHTSIIWYSFNSKIFILKSSSGSITYKNYEKREVYNYNPESNRIVLSSLSDETMPKPFGADSPWSWMESSIQRMIRFGGEVTRKTGQYNGRDVEIVEIAATLRPNVAVPHSKIFVDKATSLPIAEERVDINSNIGKPQCLDNATFEYPEHGPADIYDLGLSRDIPIINSLGLPPWRDIFKKYFSYHLQAPEKYIAIVIHELSLRDAPLDSIDICYADAGRFRKERYLPFERQLSQVGTTPDAILKWSQTLKAGGHISISIFDKSGGYYARRQDNRPWKRTKQIFEGRGMTAEDFWHLSPIAKNGWPDILLGHADVIQDDFARENNLIRIESKGRQFYLNPERDYICQRWIDDRGRITEVKEFGQTKEGKWYPKRVEGSSITNTIYLETNPVFPEGIFDPNELPNDGWQRKTGD
jgi:hypothetical protein